MPATIAESVDTSWINQAKGVQQQLTTSQMLQIMSPAVPKSVRDVCWQQQQLTAGQMLQKMSPVGQMLQQQQQQQQQQLGPGLIEVTLPFRSPVAAWGQI